MSIYSVEIKDKNKKLEYYETVFPRLNEFYENNYKTVEINKTKANKYDSLVEKIKEKKEELKSSKEYLSKFNDWKEKDYTNEDNINNCIDVLQELLDTEKQIRREV